EPERDVVVERDLRVAPQLLAVLAAAEEPAPRLAVGLRLSANLGTELQRLAESGAFPLHLLGLDACADRLDGLALRLAGPVHPLLQHVRCLLLPGGVVRPLTQVIRAFDRAADAVGRVDRARDAAGVPAVLVHAGGLVTPRNRAGDLRGVD